MLACWPHGSRFGVVCRLNGLDRSAAVFTGWVSPFLLIFDVICGKEEK